MATEKEQNDEKQPEFSIGKDFISEDELQNGKKIAAIIYALQAAGFILPITFLAAAILGYIKQEDIEGTWLESHYRWQIRTFWFALLWVIIGIATSLIFIGLVIILANGAWVIYRIAKGWLRLSEGKEMYI